MKVFNNPVRSTWSDLLKRPAIDQNELDSIVKPVLNEVRQKGDSALLHYTKKFDGVELVDPFVSEAEIQNAGAQLSDGLKDSIKQAYENIAKFHSAQKREKIQVETSPGVVCWQKQVPIEKVGIYIPGGSAPLFSTVLMLAIPAKIAGCNEIILITPPSKDGSVHPAILYAAKISGVTKMFKGGGAQAIAAMAYGTESIPATFKIFGPGNQFVTAAKQMVFKDGVAIDMPAGPSEVLVYCDESAYPSFAASDLLSQAEHGSDSQVILVTNSLKFCEETLDSVNSQLENLPRKEIAKKALENSKAIVIEDKKDALDLINQYAPEHLIISVSDYIKVAENITNAGSVFLGNYSPESAGDYASGTNHTLPTNGYARAFSGVTLESFTKTITFQELSSQGLLDLGPVIECMAENEQLEAHKNAVSIRLEKLKSEQ